MHKAINRYLIKTLETITQQQWYITDTSDKKKGFCRTFLESDQTSICIFQLGQQEEYFIVPITNNQKLALNCIYKLDLDSHNQLLAILHKVLKSNAKNYPP